ncbi:MAG: G8 domain-containing protein, partial [bacterium]
IKGASIKTWKTGVGDVTGAQFQYKVWLQGETEPDDYTVIELDFTSDDGDGNQTWAGFGPEIRITPELAPGDYEFKIRFTITGNGDPGITANGPFTATFTQADTDITFGNIQYLEGGTLIPGGGFNIYGQVYIAGITDVLMEESDFLNAWVGYNTLNSDPAEWDEGVWVEADFNDREGNNHEYMQNAADAVLASGTYYYAFRYQYRDSDFYYGGYNSGEWNGANNFSGVLRFGKNSVDNGDWDDPDTWDDGVPVEGEHVFIKDGHTVTLNTNAQVNSLTIESGGTLIVPGAQVLTIGPDGSFVNNGVFDAGEGTVIIRGTSSTGGTTATEFNNITVDGINVSLDFAATKVNGILELKGGNVLDAPELLENSTLRYAQGGNYQRVTEWNNPWNVQVSNNTSLDLNIGDFAGDLVVQGNLIIDENSSVAVDSGHDDDFIVNGDVFLHGTLALSPDIGSDMQVGGNWTRSGTFTPNNRLVTFNGVSTQALSGQTTFNYFTVADGAQLFLQDGITMEIADEQEAAVMTVETGGLLDAGTHIIDGNGSFELQSAATLQIGHPEGILSSADDGNVQTANRIFADDAIYHYTGNGNQKSGNALPVTDAAKVIIVELGSDEDELSITTSEKVLVSALGRLEIRRGTLLDTQNTYSRAIDGQGDFVMTGGNYVFSSIGTTEYKPRLTGDYTITGGNVIFEADGEQLLRGGKGYHNLTFRGNTIAVVSSGTPDVAGTVTIEDNATVDTGNSTFGDSNTNLTMTGGRLIVAGARTLPDMQGDYSLSEGTVEFAGDSDNHRILGVNRTYFNIDITGKVNNPSGNVTIREGGLFRIYSGASFSITNTAIVGEGSFEMGDSSTLFYGSPNGITLETDGTDTNKGNIRTSNRSFNPQAYYGFAGGSNMVTGSGLPSQIRRLFVQKSEDRTITLSQNLEIWNELTLTRGRLVTDGHELYLTDTNPTALVSGDGNADYSQSFIEGAFKRGAGIEEADYVFPIGRASGIQTAVVNFSDIDFSGNSTLTARFRTDIPDNFYGNLPQTFGNVLINTLSEEGFWQIDAENITSATYDISLFARGFDNINTPDGIRIVKRETGVEAWTVTGDGHTWDGGEFFYTFTQENVVGFSEFALGGNFNNNPLPVEWLSFTAQPEGGEVLLHWQTATETNNDYFTVLRSSDGEHFHPLGRLYGAGNSNQVNSYTFSDVTPLPGVSYYRVRQTDFDGQYDYSETLAVEVGAFAEATISAQNRQIHFYLPSDRNESWNYRVYNLSGLLLYAGTLNPASTGTSHVLDVSSHEGQLLVVSLMGSRSVVTKKLMIR